MKNIEFVDADIIVTVDSFVNKIKWMAYIFTGWQKIEWLSQLFTQHECLRLNEQIEQSEMFCFVWLFFF